MGRDGRTPSGSVRGRREPPAGQPVKIAIDARELTDKPTGVGRYLSQLLAAWSELPGAAAHEFILCAPQPVDVPHAATLKLTTRIGAGHGTMWEQTVLPRLVRQERADVLFSPGYTGPILSPAPMVVAVHDVSFAAHPEWFSWREGWRRRVVTRLSARRAARVLTISDFSKREITRHLGVDQTKVEVIYLGATRLSAHGPAKAGPYIQGTVQGIGPAKAGPYVATDVGAGFSRPDPLVLYVGSLFARRHIPELVGGFGRLVRRHPGLRMEIVGDNRTQPRIDVPALAAAAGAGDRIRTRAYLPDQELATLYARATAFAFLSDYEGFGLTPLEALAAGVPIVVLDTEVAREIYGPAAIYVARPEPALIESALETALFDSHERARLLEAAPHVLARYSWQECGHRTLQILLASAGA
jgi:glycosyltransferase involved in cell wall biosynthesis